MAQGLRNGGLADSLIGEPAGSWDDLLARAEKFILIEESRRIRSIHRKQILRENSGKIQGKGRRGEEPKRRHDYYTPLRVTRTEALAVVEKNGVVSWPEKMGDNQENQKSQKYCNYHQDRGHDTEECIHLQKELERLIQIGHLPEELYHIPKIPRKDEQSKNESGRSTIPREDWHKGRIIHLIEGGEYGGTTRASRKRHLRELVNPIFAATEPKNQIQEDIIFTEEDKVGIRFP
ncbi:UNVERIFIED_CONTAM: hypothetical protein Slati_3663800 [Sesamum latifolium]|uniref:Reverse transcriptase domain-containing protein n=1 Tax=Sesamum latifolium TaxID=2727402 RepID=A0AAW2U511_9LAMI